MTEPGGEHHDHERLWTQEPGYRLAIARRDRYREALQKIADAVNAEDDGLLTWAWWAHDLTREALDD